jgi:hypothetical protein
MSIRVFYDNFLGRFCQNLDFVDFHVFIFIGFSAGHLYYSFYYLTYAPYIAVFLDNSFYINLYNSVVIKMFLAKRDFCDHKIFNFYYYDPKIEYNKVQQNNKIYF